VQDLRQACRPRQGPKALRQIHRDGRFGESIEDQVRTLAVVPQLRDHATQRMGLDQHVDGAIGTEDQHARRIRPAGHIGHPGQGGVVAPVEIFQDQYQGTFGGEHVQSFGEFAQHACLARLAYGALECLPLGRR
jgi:hypothetical protein